MRLRIQSDADGLTFADGGESVRLRPRDIQSPFGDASEIVLLGEAYKGEQAQNLVHEPAL
jgi:hypothetical protein